MTLSSVRWDRWQSRVFVAGAVMLLALASGAVLWRYAFAPGNDAPAPNRPLARLEPASGTLYGVNLDWEHDSAAGYAERLGKSAAVYVAFAPFPLEPSDAPYLETFADQVLQQRGLALLTLEPTANLQDVTPQMADALAQRLAAYNARGVPVLVRFAHEMNGSWYPWSQQPTAYIRAFRLVADALHRNAAGSAMLWAPNYGAGYPFIGGAYEIQPDSADFALLDTNHDGKLDGHDDMYAPYYPGDDAVDWVGMTLYHWGDAWPWGKNIIPEADKFVNQLSGTYNGAAGDDRQLPAFYRDYAERRGKPLAIPETAAMYNTSTTEGDSELDIKRGWWRQVFSAEVARRFPMLKMINWFEWRKPESEVRNAIVDWTATRDPSIRQAFVSDLNAQQQLVFAPGPAGTGIPTPLADNLAGAPIVASTVPLPPAVASATIVSGPAVPSDFRRSIDFAGYDWRVRSANDLQTPGPNYFSDAPDHVWLDASGQLHLRAAPSADGRWYCAEIESALSHGYGTYTFNVASRVDQLDPNVAVGLFTWSDDPADYHRELDIEFAAFGERSPRTGRYTRQPYTDPNNVYLFVPPATESSAHSFTWSPSSVLFQSWTGATDPSDPEAHTDARHTFVGNVPSPGGEHVHMNIWLDAGLPPTDGQSVEIVISNFVFRPST